jgi:RNA-directed DNA polymerase
MDRVRVRVGDKRVLALVKAFLKAGILGEDRVLRDTSAGTPQGSILSPLLSNVALTVLDEHIARAPGGPASTQPKGPGAAVMACRITGWSGTPTIGA